MYQRTSIPKSLSIGELFNGQDRYIIPMYQRNYAWEEGEITQLIEDVLDYLKDNDSGTAVRMYDRLKHLKPHCSSDISEQITPYEN